VAFVPGTHYVFTAGKDRLVKFWDADRWELLLTLEGHHAEARRMHACRACRHPLPRTPTMTVSGARTGAGLHALLPTGAVHTVPQCRPAQWPAVGRLAELAALAAAQPCSLSITPVLFSLASKLWRRTWKHVCLTAVGQGEAPDGRRPPQVWCVAVSAAGDFAVSGGADRSLRVWRRTDEPFFVEEERERRLESMFEADAEVRHCCCLRRLRRCGSAAEAGCQGCGFVRDDKQQWPRYVMHQEPSIRTYRR